MSKLTRHGLFLRVAAIVALATIVPVTSCSHTGGESQQDLNFVSFLERPSDSPCPGGALICTDAALGEQTMDREFAEALFALESFPRAYFDTVCSGRRLTDAEAGLVAEPAGRVIDPQLPEGNGLVTDPAGWVIEPQLPEGHGLVCDATFAAHRLVSIADGRSATLDASTREFILVLRFGEDPTCGGITYPARESERLVGAIGRNLEQLRLADGGVVELRVETVVTVAATDCYEERGTWSGMGGDVDGEHGTFAISWDGLRFELQLRRE